MIRGRGRGADGPLIITGGPAVLGGGYRGRPDNEGGYRGRGDF